MIRLGLRPGSERPLCSHVTTEHEESVRQQILEGLIADKGGDEQVSTAIATSLLYLPAGPRAMAPHAQCR